MTNNQTGWLAVLIGWSVVLGFAGTIASIALWPKIALPIVLIVLVTLLVIALTQFFYDIGCNRRDL